MGLRRRFSNVWWAKHGADTGSLPTWAAEFDAVEGGRYMAGTTARTFAQSIALTRASDGTFLDAQGVLQTAVTDVARFDHLPVTGLRDGLLQEEARDKICLHSDDMTNAVWNTGVSMTAAKDQIGVDGVANSASSLLATSGNSTHGQDITSASATRVFFAHVKRLVGTGTIEITQDGGSTYLDITSLINSSTYTQVSTAKAVVTDPDVGFRIVTDTDKIAVQYCNSEIGGAVSSPLTVGASAVTREEDIVLFVADGSLPHTGFNNAASTFVVEFKLHGSEAGNQQVISYSIDGDDRIELYATAANLFLFAETATVIQINASMGTLSRNVWHKVAMQWNSTDIRASLNGNTAVGDTGLTFATPTKFLFGRRPDALNLTQGASWRSFVYHPSYVSQSTLEAMSA